MSSKQHRIYQLDGFAIDTSRLCLIQNGHTQHLRQKPFQVLLYLVEHRQQVVTKEELLDNIWSDVTVTDNVVEHCLAEIRKALGDDSRQPRFIKTIPRGGYRLIAPVDERFIDHGGDEEIASGANIESKQANIEARSNDAVAVHRKHGLSISPRSLLVLAAIILIGGGGTLFYSFRSGPSPSSSPNVRLPTDAGKRAVAVMFFDNASNSPELDWLREGLADMVITDLARSNGLAVLSRQQLRMLLDRVGHNQSEKIRLDEALDLAHKSQAQLVIIGSFAGMGEEILIDVQIYDLGDSELLN